MYFPVLKEQIGMYVYKSLVGVKTFKPTDASIVNCLTLSGKG